MATGELLRIGSTISLVGGGTCRVEECLGGGGQGEVYRAVRDGAPVALKWYKAQTATREQRAALENLIRLGPPDARFLWPEAVAESPNVPNFGYVMRLRDDRFCGMNDIMVCKVEPTFRTLATAGLAMADCFLKLHSRGYCYRDISFGNVFMDADTGEVLICDNDNVVVDDARVHKGGVLGTPRFMAPEVVEGQARPSGDTDRWSLAVLFFYLFVMHDPFGGRKESAIRCFDLPAMNRLYGKDAVFIFHPTDRSNEPLREDHPNAFALWPLLPRFLQERFVQTFVNGLADPGARVRETVWKEAMVRLRDSIVYGPTGASNFYDADRLRAGETLVDWATGRPLALPFRIKIDRSVVMLNHDTKLFPHHIDPVARMWDFSAPVADVSRHPTNPNLWGLRNLTDAPWTVKGSDEAVKEVAPGRSAPLAAGNVVNFGPTEGEIRI